jgi:hypothetical protein
MGFNRPRARSAAGLEESAHAMDQETVDRLMRLPEESAKRRRIVESFGCYSLASVMLQLWRASDDEKPGIEKRILAVLDDPAIE